MQKIKERIVIVIITILLIISSYNYSLATNLSYPDIQQEEYSFGSFSVEQIIGGIAVVQSLIGIIIAISLYSKSKENEMLDEYENYNVVTQEKEEPKAIKELKEEKASEEPKAIQELEEQKKLEEIRKARENSKNEEENRLENSTQSMDKENTSPINYKNQKALDDFYNYAEEIKYEKKSKKGKGKHSM